MKFFADATVNIDPDAETLAEIAVQVADAVREFDIEPRVAMISFSNFGSVDAPRGGEGGARGASSLQSPRPILEVDGEIQADTARRPRRRCRERYPFSQLTDAANVLIFPNSRGRQRRLQADGRARRRHHARARSCSACRRRSRSCRATRPSRPSST